jgi:transposase
VRLISLPPYSLELNPVEQIWALLRERYLTNKPMRSMAEVEAVLVEALNWLAQATTTLQTLSHRVRAANPST